MNLSNTEFIASAVEPKDYPRYDLSEIALAGKSNVGKSSLINKLLNRKKLAFTSSKPGKTQTLNFYRVDNKFCLVDLPGYGFARVPDSVKEEWSEMIEGYLFHRRNLKGVILIVDARHKPTDEDLMMYEWLLQMQIPHLVVGTKVDKLSNSERTPNRKRIFEKLQLEPETPFTYFSAEDGEGKKDVLKFIKELV
ncbi:MULTISPECIES: ribosome biogenesis GTP-binding protein YihA/YsxC [unclassified Candidatus Frackibacter]|uniref:ribosome biogenesis GTP-binding protein YihA/YsxC n=1 Tax=unclassified Candidatus Frackibacter TaxID=2648818 RepID=UPI0007937556|nr:MULTISPECIES: ribosome biogenesis GTP-binding protein YihA/YsxC [unclassified Candidatus Frackibacter]KXS41438.1 MAG: GTP-binding protein [Candidatus Frackibacter sp. T328-2]SDC75976.1 GTP-binding protein [Candidatus Frackibacter sp. WG11]SEM89524.1 GTP-binding protein [Candidatus Frackibacter sp. WG12]SFL99006.1 GTP-binding protein [Candidatus Frackibacter sp. WG13]